MLKNKKLAIRLVALVLTLVMAAAMFVGCNSKKLQDELDVAKADAIAAKQAAADAQNAAISAANAASELAKQLEDVQKAADDAIEAAKVAQSNAAAAQSALDSVVSGTKPVETGNLNEGDWKDVTADIAKITAELAQLRAKHLTIRYLWYTEANYLKLAQLFEDADADIYRATSPEGLTGVMTKLNADIAAVPNIASDSDPVQAQVKAFGDIDAELFTSHAANVEKARADYKEWLIKYKSYFTANGFDVNNYEAIKGALDTYVARTFGLGANNIRYAESKIATLKAYAEKVSKDAYDAIEAIWGSTTYNSVKGSHADIQAAYELYKVFFVANGGDDTPIVHENKDKKRVLTGEQFVKQYVLVLYDNWLAQYQSAAKTYVDSLPQFFMNTGIAAGNFVDLDANYLGIYDDAAMGADYKVANGILVEKFSTDQQLLNEFERIATMNAAEFLKLSYSKDFKGTESLQDAYNKIEAGIAKTIVEMSTLYYDKIALPALKANVGALKFTINSALDAFKDYDKAYNNEIKLAVDTAVAAVGTIQPKTYAELVSDKNITLNKLATFNLTVDANGDLDFASAGTYNGGVLEAVLKAMNSTVNEATTSYATVKADLADSKAFYEFRVGLSEELVKYVATMDLDTDAIFTKINEVRGTNDKVTKTIAENLAKANKTISDAYRTAVMALKYDDFAAKTYQAQSTDKKPLYYNSAALGTAKTTETAKDNKALMVQVDKLVVAKNEVVKMYAVHADQMFEKLVDLARTHVTTFINNSVETYRTNYAGDSTIDTLNLKGDVEAYITYLNGLTGLKSIGAFAPTQFSNENDQIAKDAVLNTLVDYKIETITADKEYLFHIGDYKVDSTEAFINNTFDGKAQTQLGTFCDMVTSIDANAYKSLENVRLLAYYKDDAAVTLKKAKSDAIGVYDTKKDDWTTAPTYEYAYHSSRKVMYLAAIEEVYNKSAAEINKVTLIGSKHVLADAKAAVDKVLGYLDDYQDGNAKSKSKDDMSFLVAYYRYYKIEFTNVGKDVPYNWATYNG